MSDSKPKIIESLEPEGEIVDVEKSKDQESIRTKEDDKQEDVSNMGKSNVHENGTEQEIKKTSGDSRPSLLQDSSLLHNFQQKSNAENKLNEEDPNQKKLTEIDAQENGKIEKKVRAKSVNPDHLPKNEDTKILDKVNNVKIEKTNTVEVKDNGKTSVTKTITTTITRTKPPAPKPKPQRKKKKKIRTTTLQHFMKPTPKIYKKKKIGQKKYTIKAVPTTNIETESFYARKKKPKNAPKRNLNAYEMVDFEDDESEEEELSVKFWSKKNMIRSMSSNPRGFARLMGNKINLIDQIQRLVKLDKDNEQKRGRKKKRKKIYNKYRSADVSLKNRSKHGSADSRLREDSREFDASRDKILKLGYSSNLWEQTTLKKRVYKDKQIKKKRFKHLIYSSVQVERSELKNGLANGANREEQFKEKMVKSQILNPEENGNSNDVAINVGQENELYKIKNDNHIKTSSDLNFFSRSLANNPKAPEHEEKQLRSAFPLHQTLDAPLTNPNPLKESTNSKYLLHRPTTKSFDNADGITVELDEERSVCLDDMENKLCLFFKKTLVYASKIELLKLKAQKENGEHNIYSLFRQFCDPDTGRLTTTSMQFLVQILQYPMPEFDICSILLFLEKFKMVDADAALEIDYGDYRELFISHKVNTPEIYLFSNWTPEQSQHFNLPDSEFYLLRQILHLTTRQIQDVARIVCALRAYTADSLFDYISLFNEENDKIEGHLNNFFYTDDQFEEMKQGFQVQIDFTSQRVQNQVQSKRPKSANVQMTGPSFSDNHVSKSFRNPSFAATPINESNQNISNPNEPAQNEFDQNVQNEENIQIENFDDEEEEEGETEKGAMIVDSVVVNVGGGNANNSERQVMDAGVRDSNTPRNDADLFKKGNEAEAEEVIEEEANMETRSNYSSLVKPQSILNRHVRYKKVRRMRQPNKNRKIGRRGAPQNTRNPPQTNQKEEKFEPVQIAHEFQENNEEEVEKMNQIIQGFEQKNIRVNQSHPRSFESQANMIDVSTIRNFLNFHGVMFLEEDLELVMHCLGSAHGIVDRDAFKRFFYSPLWD